MRKLMKPLALTLCAVAIGSPNMASAALTIKDYVQALSAERAGDEEMSVLIDSYVSGVGTGIWALNAIAEDNGVICPGEDENPTTMDYRNWIIDGINNLQMSEEIMAVPIPVVLVHRLQKVFPCD